MTRLYDKQYSACTRAGVALPSQAMDTSAPAPKLSFDTHPSKYRHWTLTVEADVARLVMKVQPFGGADSELELKSNSYDLGVDIELADAVQRLRFEHPEVRCVRHHQRAGPHLLRRRQHPHARVVARTRSRSTSASSPTRRASRIEDASREQRPARSSPRCNGATAGGGYELALACDEIVLVDDGTSTVALPEVPLLGVLPGTGGLTRVVDKRKVRRDLADVFSTLAEGIKGKRAVEWGLVDAVVAAQQVRRDRARSAPRRWRRRRRPAGRGPRHRRSTPLEPSTGTVAYKVRRPHDAHRAELTVTRAASERAGRPPRSALAPGARWLAAARLPRARRRAAAPALQPRGRRRWCCCATARRRASGARACDASCWRARTDALVRARDVLHMARVLRRLDLTARSFFAVVDRQSCFAGPLLELALAADRSYMLDDRRRRRRLAPAPLNGGALPDVERPLAPGDALPRRPSSARRGARGREGRPLDAAARRRAGLVHRHRRRDRLRRRAARRRRGARQPLARRAHRHGGDCASPAPRRMRRPRSSAASPPGRTGSSRAPTPPASAAR